MYAIVVVCLGFLLYASYRRHCKKNSKQSTTDKKGKKRKNTRSEVGYTNNEGSASEDASESEDESVVTKQGAQQKDVNCNRLFATLDDWRSRENIITDHNRTRIHRAVHDRYTREGLANY